MEPKSISSLTAVAYRVNMSRNKFSHVATASHPSIEKQHETQNWLIVRIQKSKSRNCHALSRKRIILKINFKVENFKFWREKNIILTFSKFGKKLSLAFF